MKHPQILNKLAARHLVQAIDDDLARLTRRAMAYKKHQSIADELNYILPQLLLRWNCVLNATDEVPDSYKQKTEVALATLLHKYGFADTDITDKAIQAIDALNNAVVLSDSFYHQSGKIKNFLQSVPVPLSRKPSLPGNTTFYRAKDVVSIQLDGRFYAAYIHKLANPNESPVIEFYEGVFDSPPTLDALKNTKATGQVYNDGIERISKFSVAGMKFMPDLANQIQLISACVNEPPSNKHLADSVGLYTMRDLFEIQEVIVKMFHSGK